MFKFLKQSINLGPSKVEQMLEIITENMNEGAILLDRSKNVIFANLRTRIILGTKTDNQDEIIKAFFATFDIPLLQRVETLNEHLVLTTEDVDIDDKTYNISFNLIKADNEMYYLVWIWDITQFRLLEKAKTEFVTIAAHQLRTPLSSIKWSLNMYLGGELGPVTNEQKQIFTKVYNTNERMIASVNELLSADRVDQERMQFSFQKYSTLYALVDSVLLDLQSLIEKSKIHIEVEIQQLPELTIDVDKIRLVFQNLLENALKYTMNGGTIKIRSEVSGEHVTMSIADSGIGIPKDQQGNIFQRFYRATNARNIQSDGSGLGLFLVQKIIEAHKGKIWFESQEGKGTTFFIQLPLNKTI
jgi:signal transduction histidine kinase